VVSAPTEVQPVLGPLEHEPRRALIVRHLCLLAPAVAAVALWAWSVPGIQLRAMNDLGLVSVLSWPTWLAFALLTLGFIICWRRADQATWLLLVHVLLLIVLLYGLPALASHQPSGPVVYRHAGITGDLIRNRVVDPRIDAYFNWPGFFMGLGTLVKLAGVPSAVSFATWAPVAFNLLFLPPLLLVARALTRDPRLVWGTVWVFYAANWINQDYLAPQSFAYLLYLTIMGLLLTYLRPSGTDLERGGRLLRRFRQVLRVRAAEAQVPPVSRYTVAGILAVVVLLYAVIVASHQLTPFAILIGVLALVALGECTARGLPLLMGVMLTLWVTFVARGYLAGHFAHLVSGVGDITGATSANLTARISGSHLHLLVIRERLLLSGGLWLLALLGGIRRFRSRYADHAAAALALTPLLLFPLQAYGGEMLLRIYFFMLPFVAFFATAAFLPARPPLSPARADPQDLAVWSERARPREFVVVWSERARLRTRLRDFLVVWSEHARLRAERARLRALPVVWSERARLRALLAVWSARARLPAALRGSVAAAAFGVTVTAVLAACLPARYGNERIDYFTPGEHAAISFLYAHARPGSTFAFEQPYLPWKYQEYELYHSLSLATMITQPHPPSPAQALAWFSRDLMPAPGNPAGFVVLTRSQHIYVHTFGGQLSLGYLGTFERLLAASPNFALVYSNLDAKIYERLPAVSHGCKVVAPWNRHDLSGCAVDTPRHRDRCRVANGRRAVVRARLSGCEPRRSAAPTRPPRRVGGSCTPEPGSSGWYLNHPLLRRCLVSRP